MADVGDFAPAAATAPDGELFVMGNGSGFGLGVSTSDDTFAARLRGDTFEPLCATSDTPGCFLADTSRWGAAAWHDGARFFVHGGVTEFYVAQMGGLPVDFATDALLSWSPAEGWTTACTTAPCSDERPSRRWLHRIVVDGDGNPVLFGGFVHDGATSNETLAQPQRPHERRRS